ncbi:MAG: hypothetical protein ACYC66_15770 [Chloroflexota bacterium]
MTKKTSSSYIKRESKLGRFVTEKHGKVVGDSKSRSTDHSRVADDVMSAIKEIHGRGGVDDVFSRVPSNR